MILNETYYRAIWEKYKDIKTLNEFNSKISCLSTKFILHAYEQKQSIHINFQNSKKTLFEIGKHLFIEFANDIYLNHYDFPGIKDGDKVKRRINGEYYLVCEIGDSAYRLNHQPRKNRKQKSPANIPSITYDNLVKGFVKVDSGIRDKTIKNYFSFFEKLNAEKIEFPRTNFERKIVFIAKKPFWESLIEKNKIPAKYLSNPREENHLSEIKSIAALSDCLVYFTPKYEVCYQNILSKGKKNKNYNRFRYRG